jgi:hypothetical protein
MFKFIEDFSTREHIDYAALDDDLQLHVCKCYADALFYGCPVYKRTVIIIYDEV